MSQDKPRLTPYARKTLEKALAVMKRRPETVDMDSWVMHNRRVKGAHPYCGTTACIAGHIALAAGAPPKAEFSVRGLDPECQKAIGATTGQSNPSQVGYALLGDEASRMFYTGSWPERFVDRYYSAVRDGKHQQVTATVIARVRHWLKTGE